MKTRLGLGVVIGMLIAGALALAGARPAVAQSRGPSGEVSCACNASQCCCGQAGMSMPMVMCR